ncbi:MAG: DUF3482 domain-containing protein [Rickettsiales bacterium]|nr:DUF3482 domain-containing protein [Rickettsiales bacterium]
MKQDTFALSTSAEQRLKQKEELNKGRVSQAWLKSAMLGGLAGILLGGVGLGVTFGIMAATGGITAIPLVVGASLGSGVAVGAIAGGLWGNVQQKNDFSGLSHNDIGTAENNALIARGQDKAQVRNYRISDGSKGSHVEKEMKRRQAATVSPILVA